MPGPGSRCHVPGCQVLGPGPAASPAKRHRAALKRFLSKGRGRFCHGRHDILPSCFVAMRAFLPWLPLNLSRLFAMAPMALFTHCSFGSDGIFHTCVARMTYIFCLCPDCKMDKVAGLSDKLNTFTRLVTIPNAGRMFRTKYP